MCSTSGLRDKAKRADGGLTLDLLLSLCNEATSATPDYKEVYNAAKSWPSDLCNADLSSMSYILLLSHVPSFAHRARRIICLSVLVHLEDYQGALAISFLPICSAGTRRSVLWTPDIGNSFIGAFYCLDVEKDRRIQLTARPQRTRGDTSLVTAFFLLACTSMDGML